MQCRACRQHWRWHSRSRWPHWRDSGPNHCRYVAQPGIRCRGRHQFGYSLHRCFGLVHAAGGASDPSRTNTIIRPPRLASCDEGLNASHCADRPSSPLTHDAPCPACSLIRQEQVHKHRRASRRVCACLLSSAVFSKPNPAYLIHYARNPQ